MTSPVGLWIDFSGTGFGNTAYDDCTALIRSIRYRRGGTPDITGAAQGGSCTIRLRNPGALFDPDNTLSPLYGMLHDGLRVWFGANEDGTLEDKGATVRGRFAGRTLDFTPIPVAGAGDSTPEVEITCEDAKGWYARTPVSLSVAAQTEDYIPPLPAPLTCSASITAGVVSTVNSRAYTSGSYDVTVSPSVHSALLVGFFAYDPNTPGDTAMALSGGGVTQLITHDAGHETTALGWAAGSAATTFTGAYTPGYSPASSVEAAIAVALPTSATAPVQSATGTTVAGGIGTPHPTFGATPTPGNIIVLQLSSATASPPDGDLYPNDGRWTRLGYATMGLTTAVYARCVQLGDGSSYGTSGGSYARTAAISEWTVP